MTPTNAQHTASEGLAVLACGTLCAAIALLTGASAHASLKQTLVFFRDTDSLKIFGATPQERADRILAPTVAMTKKTAEFLSDLSPGQTIQCDVEAFKQDLGKNPRIVVWNLYSVDRSTCVAK